MLMANVNVNLKQHEAAYNTQNPSEGALRVAVNRGYTQSRFLCTLTC